MNARSAKRVVGLLAVVAMAVLPAVAQNAPAVAASAGTLFGIDIRTASISKVDPALGTLTALADLSLPPGQLGPGFSDSMVDNPATRQLYLVRVVVDNSTFPPTQFDQLITVDTTNGALTVSPALSHPVTALALDASSGALFGFTGDCCPNQIVRIDPVTGVLTNVANVVGDSFSFMAIDPATHLLYIARESFATFPPTDQMLTVNTLTGTVTQSPVLTFGISNLVFDTSSRVLFGVTFGGGFGGPHLLVQVNPASGAETQIGSYDFGMFLEPGIAIDSSSHTIYVVQDVFDPIQGPIAHIASINDQTGAGVLGGTTGTNIAAIAFEPILITDESIQADVQTAFAHGMITGEGLEEELLVKLNLADNARDHGHCGVAARMYKAFIGEVKAESGRRIDAATAAQLMAEAQFLIKNCP